MTIHSRGWTARTPYTQTCRSRTSIFVTIGKEGMYMKYKMLQRSRAGCNRGCNVPDAVDKTHSAAKGLQIPTTTINKDNKNTILLSEN